MLAPFSPKKGRPIDVGLLGGNHHKIKLIAREDPLLNVDDHY